jgi:hypothetical protein
MNNDELIEEYTFELQLQDCCFDVLRENPGSTYDDWKKNLIAQYPAEVVDALGAEPLQVYATLAQWWREDYTDPATGITKTYAQWAEVFANKSTVEIYTDLVNALAEKSKSELR